jgi:hypothetical protein
MGRKKLTAHTPKAKRKRDGKPAPTPAALELQALLKSSTELVVRDASSPGAPRATATEDGCQAIMLLASEGADQWTMAHKLGIGRSTLQKWIKEDERVEAALAIGKAQLADECTHLLLTAARKGNIVAAIYLTKARLGWREGDAPDVKPNIIINLPDAHTPEAYLRMIEVNPKKDEGR